MNDTVRLLAPALGGALLAAALIAVVAFWRGAGVNPEVFRRGLSRRVRHLIDSDGARRHELRPTPRTGLTALGAVVVVWAVSGWPVAGLAAGVLVVAGPWLLNTNAVANKRINRLEGLEKWCRQMADRLSGSGATGLVQVIRESARRAPDEVGPEVKALAQRLSSTEWGYSAALQAFADDIDDATGDDVAAALMLALDRQGAGTADVLRRLATQIAREVRSRDEVEAERAEPRQAMRVLLLMLAGLVLGSTFVPVFHDAYTSAIGQLIMAVLLTFGALLLVRMRTLALGTPAPRFLTGGTAP